MKKGQWSSTAAMAHYLHHDDEAKQDAQMKRIKRRAGKPDRRRESEHLSEWKCVACLNRKFLTAQVIENIGAGEGNRTLVFSLEVAKFRSALNCHSDILQPRE